MVNTLRLGIVHLSTEQLDAQLDELKGMQQFAEALSRVTAGDAGQRLRIVQALSWYETEWVFRLAGLGASQDQSAARGHAAAAISREA